MEQTFKGVQQAANPGHRYEAVDVSGGDYAPSKGGMFRGFCITGNAGNVVIQDAAGNNATFITPARFITHWLGGLKIVSTSTATGIVAILDF